MWVELKHRGLLLICLVFFSLVDICYAGNARFRSIEFPVEYGELLVRSITQSQQGYLLFGTNSGIYQYDGYKFRPYLSNSTHHNVFNNLSVNKMQFDSHGALWIATRGAGLYRYDSGKLMLFSTSSRSQQAIESDYISDILVDEHSYVWLATDAGLSVIDDQFKVIQSHSFGVKSEIDAELKRRDNQVGWQFMTALLSINPHEFLIGTKAGLLVFDQHKHTFEKIHLMPEQKPTVIYTLHQDSKGGIWIGSDDGVFYRSRQSNTFSLFKPESIPFKIPSITSKGDDIWMGSISNGLFHYSLSNQTLAHFVYQREYTEALSDNTIVDLFIDTSDVLWISTFYKGLNNLDTQSLHFGLENDAKGSVECASNLLFSGFVEDMSGDLWIANGPDLLQYNNSKGICQRYPLNLGSHTVKGLLLDSQQRLWIASTKGLLQFDRVQKQFLSLPSYPGQALTNFVIEHSVGHLLLGTIDGLFTYDTNENVLTRLESDIDPNVSLKLFSASVSAQGEYHFATNIGVMRLSNNRLIMAQRIQSQIDDKEILAVYFDTAGRLWVGTDSQGVYVFNQEQHRVFHESRFGDARKDSVRSIIQAKDGDLWIGSGSGLIHINKETFDFNVFYPADGIQGLSFNINAAYRDDSGRLYVGGRNGFNAFDPQRIQTQSDPPKIMLTDFTRFGKSVPVLTVQDNEHTTAQEFFLKKPINQIEELALSHKDYVIGFEFAVLDYSDPKRNRYAFQMQGLDPDWNYVNANNRRISYSNLNPGRYVFRVKGANKHGVWSTENESIVITVSPTPWLAWWAISGYIVMFLFSVWWLMGRKNRMNQNINRRLTAEVERQTQALQAEKKTVEDLLNTKNQLFANVSHEFRTPLTLILGPVKRLLSAPVSSVDHQVLTIINRNAHRLLTMIEQLLQLAKFTGKSDVTFHYIESHRVVEALISAFQGLAESKHISLKLLSNDKAILHLTHEALDVIFSNLLSNAIKYTPDGGEITVHSRLQNGRLYLSVADTGPGLDDGQKKRIFERFKRLDRDHAIEGIGIGLSVVKDLVDLNKGEIMVDSQAGAGSLFTVIFNVSMNPKDDILDHSEVLLVNQLTQPSDVIELELDEISSEHNALKERDERRESVLIIDDNQDMLNYIASTLSSQYQCLQANGGQEGIAKAIKYVPDVVICDVMMPEIDGFHVSRVLRSDTRTSHIPLILLTALDDKASRIRGWREHVDVYLTKPFDEKELLLQLENILVIRSILNKKVGSSMHFDSEVGLVGLPKKDQQFITKLNAIIKDNYKNPNFLRQHMASKMALSERQLQRKLKALIDKNPIDLLREYRLHQAAVMLKDGFQVSQTAEACGFNSLPHFSKCFKSQFGLSPKAYQTTCK